MSGDGSNDVNYSDGRFRRLTTQQCERLHSASLEILERTGVMLYEPEAVTLLKKAGASVSDGNRVRIPASLVEKAFHTVPKRVVLCDRQGEEVLFLEGRRSYYGPGSDCLNIIDHRTLKRRQPVLQDINEGITVCDALPNIDFVMSLFVPADVNPSVVDRYQMQAMLTYTTKPIIIVTYDLAGCVDAVEMAEAVAGGPEALRQRPLVGCYINVTTGLVHNAEALQKLLYLAEKRLPALYIPVITGGITGPITIAGNMAMVNAGVLTGLAISQLKQEGAPYIVPGWGGETPDMSNMILPYCNPDPRGMAQELAHYYNLPSFGIGGASEAKLIDGQAGAEAALTLLVDTLSGANLIHDMGYLESGLTFSLAQLAICDEIVGWIQHFTAGIEISEESLALDLIDELGPEGQFLKSRHTRQHFRRLWHPELFRRDNYASWLADGGKSVAQRAADRVATILAEHVPDPLTAEASQAIDAIVRRAEAGVA
jgi:trimethylamine--corrinoid protein Co-methyltransferase